MEGIETIWIKRFERQRAMIQKGAGSEHILNENRS